MFVIVMLTLYNWSKAACLHLPIVLPLWGYSTELIYVKKKKLRVAYRFLRVIIGIRSFKGTAGDFLGV